MPKLKTPHLVIDDLRPGVMLRTILTQRRVGIGDAAYILGVSSSEMSRILNHDHLPTRRRIDVIEAIEREYGIPAERWR